MASQSTPVRFRTGRDRTGTGRRCEADWPNHRSGRVYATLWAASHAHHSDLGFRRYQSLLLVTRTEERSSPASGTGHCEVSGPGVSGFSLWSPEDAPSAQRRSGIAGPPCVGECERLFVRGTVRWFAAVFARLGHAVLRIVDQSLGWAARALGARLVASAL